MSEYLKTIVASVFAVGIISVLFSKDGFGKYVGVLSSIIVITIIASPIINNSQKNLDFEALDIEELEFNTNSYIMEEFEKELSEKVSDKLKSATGIEFSVTVYANKTDEVVEIEKIEIAPYSKEYVTVISEYLEVDERRIVQK